MRLPRQFRIIAVVALLAAATPLGGARATTFALAKGQPAVGRLGHYVTRYKDTLLDVARDNDLGYTQLIVANPGIDPWLPGKNKHVVLPAFYILPDAARRGIVVNLAERRLYYYPRGGKTVETYPIGVGVQGWKTPLGFTRVVTKHVHPAWYPPASIRKVEPDLPRVVPAGPDNPLGDFAMQLGWNGYLIHGTDKPWGVGRNVSHGCIRLYPEDIDPLFHAVPVGTPVHVVKQDVEAAWINGALYVVAFPSKSQTDQLDLGQAMTPAIPDDLSTRVTAVAGNAVGRVDWDKVRQIGLKRTGIPTRVTPPLEAAEHGGIVESDLPNAPLLNAPR